MKWLEHTDVVLVLVLLLFTPFYSQRDTARTGRSVQDFKQRKQLAQYCDDDENGMCMSVCMWIVRFSFAISLNTNASCTYNVFLPSAMSASCVFYCCRHFPFYLFYSLWSWSTNKWVNHLRELRQARHRVRTRWRVNRAEEKTMATRKYIITLLNGIGIKSLNTDYVCCF